MLTLVQEYAAAAVGAAGAPLGDKDGQALRQSLVNPLTQPLSVGAGIEVERVHQILSGQRVGGRFMNILAPGRAADQDDGAGRVLPNRGNHRGGVGLYIPLPGHVSVGLVANLIEYGRVVTVPRRHFPEKVNRLRGVVGRISV